MRLAVTKYKFIADVLIFTFWVCATLPFVIQEVSGDYHLAEITKLWFLIEIVVTVLGLWTLKARADKVVLAIYLALSLFDTIIVNKLSFIYWLNGCRMYIGFLFMFPIIRYFWTNLERRRYFVARMDRLLYLYLVIQFPCMVVQCIRYGAYDNVSGSIGWMASGTASTIIYLISFYLMLRRWNPSLSYMQNLRNNWDLLFLLLPTWMNETKVSFIYIAMYFFFLVPMDKQFVKRMLVVGPLMAVVLAGALYLYSTLVSNSDKVDLEMVQEYVLGNEELVDLVEFVMENDLVEYEGDYARGLKFYVVPEIFSRHDAWLTGFGVDQIKGGSSGLDKSEFAKQYYWVLNGTQMQFYIALIDMGVPGAILYLIYWIWAFRLGKRYRKERNRQMTWMFGLTTLLFSFYIPPFIIPPFYVMFMFMVFAGGRWNELPPYQRTYLPKITFSTHD